jgi:hypothetical protein
MGGVAFSTFFLTADVTRSRSANFAAWSRWRWSRR